MPDEVVTTVELAACFGVSERTIRELTARGVIAKAAPGRYELRASIRAYAGHLREQAAGRDGGNTEIAAERLREARERADKIALANAKARRELVPAAEVERAWSEVLRDVRARMLAVPARCMARIGRLSPTDTQVIEQEVRDALQGAADAS